MRLREDHRDDKPPRPNRQAVFDNAAKEAIAQGLSCNRARSRRRGYFELQIRSTPPVLPQRSGVSVNSDVNKDYYRRSRPIGFAVGFQSRASFCASSICVALICFAAASRPWIASL